MTLYNPFAPNRMPQICYFGGGGGSSSSTSEQVSNYTDEKVGDVTGSTETKETTLTDAQKANKKKQQDLVTSAMDGTAATKADVAKIKTEDNQFIKEGTGQLSGDIKVGTATVDHVAGASKPKDIGTATYNAETDATQKTAAVLSGFTGAQGQVSFNSLAQAAQQNPDTLKQLGLSAAQIQQAVQVLAPNARKIEQGELVDGSAVDWAKAEEVAQKVEAQTADPTARATVQGQLEKMYSDFEGKNPPAWAAGAMRAATAKMNERGLGASSMAGMAVVQAAMESATPIAMADAKTFAEFEQQNLSNRQQAAMISGQMRAQFLGQDFDQKFQTKVANAAKISDIANQNFTAEQQIALENARFAQSVDLTNLSAVNAKILSDAGAMSQMDLTNLSNRQQSAVQRAQAFLQMDVSNLNNRQQAQVIKAQSLANALLSDQAAQNASLQFNAASENQTRQFMASLTTDVEKFNAAQTNAIAQFNAGEKNATAKFNAEMQNNREQFNAKNSLIVAQANAKWRQEVATADTKAQNDANRDYAKATNDITQQSLDAIYQRERDLMSYSFQSTENARDRKTKLLLGDKSIDADSKSQSSSGIGYLVGSLLFGN